MSEALILDCRRTPRGKGKPNGALHRIHPQELFAQVLNALADAAGFDPSDVDDVIAGNGMGDGDHSNDIARLSVLAAGWPDSVPGVTVNRYCGSGQQAITFAAQGVASGFQDLVVAGGVESMSRYLSLTTMPNLSANNDRLARTRPMVPQGVSGDLIASIEGFTREQLDAFSAESQRRAAAAITEGRFDKTMIAVTDDDAVVLAHEEFLRPATTAESLASLPPAFEALGALIHPETNRTMDQLCLDRYPQIDKVQHVHHAGSSSGVVDGSGAVAVASRRYADAHGLRPRARIRSTAVAGADPLIMLTAPSPASQRCLDRAGMTVADIDLWEINEAFAAIPLKVMRDLGIDGDRVNVNGGAIALGHPIGATGAILIATVLDELERRDLQTGLVTMCTAAGMGTATIIERI
jgi:acetyl-CoA C-acetyltransferase